MSVSPPLHSQEMESVRPWRTRHPPVVRHTGEILEKSQAKLAEPNPKPDGKSCWMISPYLGQPRRRYQFPPICVVSFDSHVQRTRRDREKKAESRPFSVNAIGDSTHSFHSNPEYRFPPSGTVSHSGILEVKKLDMEALANTSPMNHLGLRPTELWSTARNKLSSRFGPGQPWQEIMTRSRGESTSGE